MPNTKLHHRQKDIPINRLIGMALQEWDSDNSWDALWKLRKYAKSEMLIVVRRLSQSKNWRKRVLAIQIVCQLHTGSGLNFKLYAPNLAHEIMFRGLEDHNIHVVEAAIYGFGHCMHPDAPQRFLPFVKSPSVSIRYALASALSGGESNQIGLSILLELANDEDELVRDWATFAIGTQNDADTPEIRAMLWKNVKDVDEIVRSEAMMGLARRKDSQIVPVLIAALVDDHCQSLLFDAAIEINSPALLEPLQKLYTKCASDSGVSFSWLVSLKEAIAFYDPNSNLLVKRM